MPSHRTSSFLPYFLLLLLPSLPLSSSSTLHTSSHAQTTPPTLPPPSSLTVEYLPSPLGVDVISPRFSFLLPPDPSPSSRGTLALTAYQLVIVQPVPSNATIWDSSIVPSSTPFLLPYTGPSPLPSDTLLSASVRYWVGDPSTTSPSPFATTTFRTSIDPTDWEAMGAQWITGTTNSSIYLRGSIPASFFSPSSPSLTSLTIYAAGIGYSEFYCNGQQLGGPSRRRDPGWTDFSKRVFYVTLDATECALSPSSSSPLILGAVLGNGWFSSRGWYAQPPYPEPTACNGGGFSYPTPPQLLLVATAVFSDGSRKSFPSSPSTFTTPSTTTPILFDSIYDGEWVNGSLASAFDGWSTPTFSPTSDWLPATVVSPSSNPVNSTTATLLTSALFPPIEITELLAPAASWPVAPNSAVYDFGRYVEGVVRLSIPPNTVSAGDTVTLVHAEVLLHPPYGPANGSIYTGSNRNAHATDVYIAAGLPSGEVFEPRFTFHGFRYVQITGITPPLPPSSLTGLMTHTNAPTRGSLALGSQTLAAIHSAAALSIRTNLQAGPGSCGARDERQFFTGDTALGAEASMLNFALAPLFTRAWLLAGVDEQNSDGSVGYYLPTPIEDARDGSPNWSTGWSTVAHLLMREHGDLSGFLPAHLPHLLRYVAFLEGKYNATAPGLANFWAEGPTEWVNLGPSPNPHLVNAFAFLHDVQMAGEMAQACGDAGNATRLAALLASLRGEFHASFFNTSTNSSYGSGTQTEQALALWIGAYPDAETGQRVAAALADDILVANEGHVLTGIIGTRFIFEALSRFGLSDVVLTVLLNTSYPGYGYMVTTGGGGGGDGNENPEPSTTLWEEWNTPQEPAIMASRNHLMFASVDAWLYQRAAGIFPLSNAYGSILIAPQAVDNPAFPFAAASLATPYGTAAVSWQSFPSANPADGTCGEAEEANAPAINSVNLTCAGFGPNATIAGVTFASFGTPSGSCGGEPFAVSPSCNAASSLSIVEAACVGKASCGIPVSDTIFSDPCPGTKKWLAANVTCSGGGGGGGGGGTCEAVPQLPLVLNATVPPGTTAWVVLPLRQGGRNATCLSVMEGLTGATVWSNGTFVGASSPGVVNGSLLSPTSIPQPSPIPAIGFFVLSGVYSFVAG